MDKKKKTHYPLLKCFRISETDYIKLDEIANANGASKSEIIRNLIRNEYRELKRKHNDSY
jgi:metal-responsive CopG/Arc/MetJ family transcriptional regulator